MKLIAYYLPQYHEIPENNEWWGKGFTEWSNVKKMSPLFKGHRQPRVPLDDNYYDLMDKKTVEWETNLLDEYNVYGLCYYHYWFAGRKLLERPAENLLKWKDINQKFCFCWANATWRKTWTKGNEILLDQQYFGKDEWLAHLEYLLPFFKDERYIKVDNKPVFVVLNLYQVDNSQERFKFYNDFCKKNGFNGIELVQSINGRFQKVYDYVNSITLREPSITHVSINNFFQKVIVKFKRDKKFNLFIRPLIYKWERIQKNSVEYDSKVGNIYPDKKIYLGAFKEWDSTSRHGKHGYIITKSTKNQFRDYLLSLRDIINVTPNISEFVFFTAWNEWCECCYLQPDTDDGYDYLEVIKETCEK